MGRTGLASALALALAGAASAQTLSVDANGDGMISFPEAQQLVPELEAEAFSVLDVSGDGLLDDAELDAAVEGGHLPDPEK